MWVAIAVVCVIIFLMYNASVGKKNQVVNAFTGMDTILKKRYDLVSNWVDTVKLYMEHEASVLGWNEGFCSGFGLDGETTASHFVQKSGYAIRFAPCAGVVSPNRDLSVRRNSPLNVGERSG